MNDERGPSRYSLVIPADTLVLMLVMAFIVGFILGVVAARSL